MRLLRKRINFIALVPAMWLNIHFLLTVWYVKTQYNTLSGVVALILLASVVYYVNITTLESFKIEKENNV